MSGIFFGGTTPATYLNPGNFVNNFMNPNAATPASYNYGNIPQSSGSTPIVDANGNITYTYSNGSGITIRPDGTNTSVPQFKMPAINTQLGVSPGFIIPVARQTTSPTQNQYNWGGGNYTVNPGMPPNVGIGFGPAPLPAQAVAPKPNPFAAVTKPAPKAAPKPVTTSRAVTKR